MVYTHSASILEVRGKLGYASYEIMTSLGGLVAGSVRLEGVMRGLKARAILIIGAVACIAMTACSPIQRFHGYAPDDTQLAEIDVGRDTRDDVAEKIGRPGMTGVMEGSSWYYVQSDWLHRGWRAPVEQRRELVAISFNQNDLVSSIERFGLEDGEVVPLSRRVTSTGDTRATLLRQILRNFGRFDAAQALGRD